MPTAMLTHCQGCDQDQEDVRAYSVQFISHPQRESVDYCPDCAALAAANWTGEVASIEPELAA
jgi:hypothetical protein